MQGSTTPSPSRKVILNGGGGMLPKLTGSALAVYPPSSRKTTIVNQNGQDGKGLTFKSLANGKRRIVSDDAEVELIKTQIFAHGKKPEIKLTLFPEMYSCSDCSELFYTQLGLVEHHQREVFSALLNCPHCFLKKSFGNRCQLLNHFKSHGVTPTAESLKSFVTFDELPNEKEFHDYSISIPTRHAGFTPSAPTTIIPSQLDVVKTETPLVRGERQYKIIPIHNIQKNPSPTGATASKTSPLLARGGVPIKFLTRKAKTSINCNSCGVTFSDGVSFVEHSKASQDGMNFNRCEIDGVPLRSKCEQAAHTNIFHDKKPPFFCLECGAQFAEFHELSSHERSECYHLRKAIIYSCKYHGRGGDEAACADTEKYAKSSLIIKHLHSHSRDIHKCGFCPQALLTADLLQMHVSTVHKDEPLAASHKPVNLFQCLICSKVFATKVFFQEHFSSFLEEHTNISLGFHCGTCCTIFDDAKGFGSHKCTATGCHNGTTEIKHQPVETDVLSSAGKLSPKCIYCKVSFPTVRALKRHQPNCDLKASIQRKPEFCKVCSKTLQGSKSFLTHGVTHLNAGFNICLYCNNQELDNDENLESHLKSHAQSYKPYPHICIFCDEELQDTDEATAHFLSHHEKATNRFKCATCGSQFDSVSDLTHHKTSAHSVGGTRLTSTSTPANKSRAGGNRSRVTRPAFSYSYQCKFCPERKFQTRPGLRKHLRNHHGDVEFTVVDWNEMRKITCTAVNATPAKPGSATNPTTAGGSHARRSQKDKLNVTNHHRTHPAVILGTHSRRSGGAKTPSNEVPEVSARRDGTFTCLKCIGDPQADAVFNEETDFYDHVREAHVWKEDDAFVELAEDGESDSSKSAVPVRDKSFWCPECSLEFVAKPSFRMHLQFAHSYIKKVNEYMDEIGYGKRERPLKDNQCAVCRMVCPDSTAYSLHLRTHGMAFLRRRLQRPSV